MGEDRPGMSFLMVPGLPTFPYRPFSGMIDRYGGRA